MKGIRDDILTLPVSKMCITTAIGARNRMVKGQALLAVGIANSDFQIPCIGIFSETLGCMPQYSHEIHKRDKTPFFKLLYPIAMAYKAEAQRQISEMLDFGIISAQQNLTVALLRLLHKTARWEWGAPEEADFQAIKQAFLRAIVLAHPDFGRLFYIEADSSDPWVFLYQMDDQNEVKNFAFASRTLKEPEVNYTLQNVAIVFALNK
nr:unnamed protein product [Callosobruchus analis]